ncbi:MAG: hypothetical protein HZC41_06400 [Chloroflexi bacterium]|nr:hypothetical protein [Chloroflexota bacterium]
MKEPERQHNQSAEQARQRAEAKVETTADVEGAAAAMHESERRSPADIASQARAAQEAKAVAEGKDGDKDTPPAPPKRPGNFTGEDTDLATDAPPPNAWRGQDKPASQAEAEREVDENINTDPAALEETGEVYSPPGPSVSHRENP